MNMPRRMSLLSVFWLLPFAFLGAAGTTIDIATPMPAPEWATLERRILADSVPAAKAFFAKYYDERGYSPAVRECMDGFATLDLPQVLAQYKARPLQGAWATAPFLHNGSVPNLYELLSPVTERSKRFFLGRREYDPVKVEIGRAHV